jgi:hypothetical protein
MTTSHFTLRTALAAASLALSFTLAHPGIAAENPKTSTPAATSPQERDSQEATRKDRSRCKKIYRRVHRGHPGKGTVALKLVRIECPTPRA